MERNTNYCSVQPLGPALRRMRSQRTGSIYNCYGVAEENRLEDNFRLTVKADRHPKNIGLAGPEMSYVFGNA